jgi:hypothetical protein
VGARIARTVLVAGAILASGLVQAAEPAIPAGSPNCGLQSAPAEAGAYGTPGGFLLAYPRNRALPRDYTGCKTLWVVQSPTDMPLLMRLYFRNGVLALAQGYDGRGGTSPRGICSNPDPRPECEGIDDNPLMALHTPTWPRVCMEQPDQAVCAKDPE